MAEQQNSRYKELLDELQLQSWQLELVISGFAIFGLFSALEPIVDFRNDSANSGQDFLMIFLYFLNLGTKSILSTLILHVIIRSMWIGAIGLRSVSGEIDYKSLRFSAFFTKKLQIKIGSFDDYIDRLEKYSSVLFALSFLIFFYIVGFFVAIFVIWIPILLLFNFQTPHWIITACMIVMCVYYAGLILVFIDFMTLGFFKRKTKLSKWYYPIYVFYGWMTLSFFYRHLYYNFHDNKFGRRLIRILVPFYLILFFLPHCTKKIHL